MAAQTDRIDRIIRIVIAVLAAAIIAFGGYFGWSIYRDRQAAQSSTPALRVVRALKEQVKDSPNDVVLRVRLGEALAAAGRDQEAVVQLEAALKIDPEHTGALLDLGQIAASNNRPVDAERYFKRIVDLTTGSQYEAGNERREVALFQLGVISLSDRRYEDAIGYFKEALRIRKDASDTYYYLALALDGIGEPEEAKKQLQIALAFDPNFGQAHYYLGQLYIREGDKAAASTYFAEAVRIDPEAPEPREALEALGTFDELLAQAKKLQESDPKAALSAATIAANIDPKSAEAVKLEAELLEKAGEKEAALEGYEAALKLVPGDKDVAAAIERLSGKKSKKDD